MTGVNSEGVKELIEALKKLHGKEGKSASWTDLESIYGVSRQTLFNWSKGSKEHAQLFDFVEKARKDLGYKENYTYRLVIKKKPTHLVEGN